MSFSTSASERPGAEARTSLVICIPFGFASPDRATSFEKAATLKDNGISKNNLAATTILDGNKENAKKLIAQAKTAFDSKGDASQKTAVNYNQGILSIMDAKYAAADASFSENSYNKALAQVLSSKLVAA
jgi:hypothetical protein